MSSGAEGGRTAPAISVHFDRAGRRYAPGAPIAIQWRVDRPEDAALRAVELSVAWYTEGKGEEDLAVHAFDRIVDRGDPPRPTVLDGVLETTLPPSPLSYEGVIVKIRWCFRLRVFFVGGRDYVSEHVFHVGEIPPARPPVVPEDTA